MEVNQPPAKKPRTQAQVDAFEKARKVREENLRKKFQKEQEQEKAKEEAHDEEMHEQEDTSTLQTPVAAPTTTTTVTVEPPLPSPLPQVQEDDSEDVDVSELFNVLYKTQDELQKLKESFSDISSKHNKLEESFQTHQVARHNSLNFI